MLSMNKKGGGFLGGSAIKNPLAMQEAWVQSLGWEDPLEKEMQPTPIFSSGESHGLPPRGAWWAEVHGLTESDTTEVTKHSM